ncbi:hypothetical protein AVEN_235410-1 [Araneus ventricosus]|uniref:Uncharacterized protein n=1 Tax=Araneus ventricosus TaxID=182803 RepID=A0A4Y2A6B7_ARAVE|nr:hypothetical protein AVEN_235410-1 [Araneus ventricosus]
MFEPLFSPYLFRRECWAYVTLPYFFSPGNGALFERARAKPGHAAATYVPHVQRPYQSRNACLEGAICDLCKCEHTIAFATLSIVTRLKARIISSNFYALLLLSQSQKGGLFVFRQQLLSTLQKISGPDFGSLDRTNNSHS